MAVDKFIKKVQVGTSTVNDLYDIAALYIREVNNNTEVLHTWQDIENLITVGFTIVVGWSKTNYDAATAPQDLSSVPAVTVYYNEGRDHTTGGLPAYLPSTRQHIYLIYRGGSVAGSDLYDEYVATGAQSTIDPDTGDPVIPAEGTYSWERIGSTNIDLSQYALKTQAAAAGNYITAGCAPSVTGGAGGGTFTTSSDGDQSATGTATITYNAAPTVTGEAGGGTSADTGEAGGVTISGSNFTFTGTTATLSKEPSNGSVQIDAHQYTPQGSITGTQAVNGHSHTVNLTTASAAIIADVDDLTGEAGAHTHEVTTHSHGASVTAIESLATGEISQLSETAIHSVSLVTANTPAVSFFGFSGQAESLMALPTVDNSGILSWSLLNGTTGLDITYTNASTSTATIVTGASTTVSAAGVESVATLTTSSTGAHTHSIGNTAGTITYVTGATLDVAGGHTIDGSNFTFSGSATVLHHTQVATDATLHDSLQTSVPAFTITYQPQGTIGGSQVVSAHSHSYTAPAAHTHSITPITTTATTSVEVAVSAHTHTITLADHTHGMSGHTHSITLPPISTPTA